MRFVEGGVGTMRVVELPRLPEDQEQEQDQNRVEDSAVKVKTKRAGKEGDVDAKTLGPLSPTTRLIINLPAGVAEPTAALEKGQSTYDLRKVQGVKLANGHMIHGPYVQPLKGSNGSVATLKVHEGLWEHRRGHKVDGGERRKAEVRFKRGVEERRKARV